MQPNGDNPYDFIMQDRPKPKLRLAPSGNSTSSRIIMVVGGALVLIILAVVAFSVLSGGNGAGSDSLLQAAKEQAEIIRITGDADTKAGGRDTKTLALTANLSLSTDQTTLLSDLSKLGKKTSAKDLASATNAQHDAMLSAAQQANQYDTALTALVKQLLIKYKQDLDTAANVTSGNVQLNLKTLSAHASTLIGQ